jgi:hypothetical protein
MTFLKSNSRSWVLCALGLASLTLACAAPTTTSPGDEDDAASVRSARKSASVAPDAPGGESRTVQMLIDLQSSRAPLEGGERARIVPPSATPAAAPPKAAAPAVAETPSQNPFARALEMGKPAVTRELRGPTVVQPTGTDQAGRPDSAEAALRAERYGAGAGPGAEQALRDKIGGDIPLPMALMRYIRENRTTVLVFSVLSLALVGWMGARAAQKRN